MWTPRLWEPHDTPLLLCITLYVCHIAEALTQQGSGRALLYTPPPSPIPASPQPHAPYPTLSSTSTSTSTTTPTTTTIPTLLLLSPGVAPQRSLTRAVQEDVVFSVSVASRGVPTLRWTFMSGAVSRSIGSWRPGDGARGDGVATDVNITEDYRDRVETYANGSLGLARLRLQDAGFYVLTVTEDEGRRRRRRQQQGHRLRAESHR
ncbi:hypothetical protein CRUP_033825 [Coryphaenoides rupestris]|nr:hypothetical protein CRUP_033825 [Coryphaenoides rupestris]